MKQLHRKILKAVALICIGLAFMIVGCAPSHTETTQPENDHGLVKVDNYRGFVVFKHVDTGVYYLYSGYGGFTPLLNADGTPYCGE